MKKQNISALLLAMTFTLPALLSACGNEPSVKISSAEEDASVTSGASAAPASDTTSKKDDPPVELTYYFTTAAINEAEMNRIMEKANAIIEEKINANLKLVNIPSEYGSKINMMINSGDAFDLCFSASWLNNFYGLASDGAFADLTDLLPQYAPESYKRVPQGLWDGVTIDNKIYAVVNYQQWGASKRKGFAIRSDIAEEVGFDWKALKGKSSMEALKLIGSDYLAKACAAHPDMIGWEGTGFSGEPLLWDMEPVGSEGPGWIRYNEPNKVINQFETEEFAEFCGIMREWYQNGYMRKDVATVTDVAPDRQAARMLAAVIYGWPDTLDAQTAGFKNPDTSKMSMCTEAQAPASAISTTRTVIPASEGANACTTINAQSKNINKALELIELLNTHDELYMLLTQGEEGVDYTYDANGSPQPVGGKYSITFAEYQLGQSFSPTTSRALYPQGDLGEQQKKSQQFVFKADETAEASPLAGFTFNSDPVKTQVSQCTAVTTELLKALETGSVDPAKKLPELLNRLKAAGVDEIIAEKQAQYDAWMAAK